MPFSLPKKRGQDHGGPGLFSPNRGTGQSSMTLGVTKISSSMRLRDIDFFLKR